MAPLQKELSSLEVEPLETVVPSREGFYTPPGFDTVRSQNTSLDTLTTVQGDVEIAALLTGKGAIPVNEGGACCCCCCAPCC